MFVALRFLGQKLVIIARIKPKPLVPDFGNLVDRHIQKITVVRNQQKSMRIIMQVFFQPVASFKVEVVSGFVEQQQVWLLQQQLRQGEPHLPTT